MVPVRQRDCADSGSVLDEFKLFDKSCKPKWSLRKETGLGGALGICYSRRTDDGGKKIREDRRGARFGVENSWRHEHDRDCGSRTVRVRVHGVARGERPPS